MKNTIMANGLKRSLAQIRYVSPVQPASATGLVASVYGQAEKDFGMVAAPVALHSPAPLALAASWAMLRETLLATGEADRAEKEVVAAAVSAANTCPYCVAIHTAAAHGVMPGLEVADVASGNLASPRLKEIWGWARSSGQPGSVQAPPPGSFAELAGVAVTFQYLNRMVTIFLPESPLPPMTPKAIGGWVMGMLAEAMTTPQPVPGASLDLLPDAQLPDEFSWAAGDSRIAAALAGAAAAVEEAASGVVTKPVRELVAARLAAWDGRPPGPSRSWVDEAVAGLDEADRAAGRLALLAVFAPHQVGKADVAALRATDEAIVTVTSWASMAAARTAGSWLG
jgi:AhpD family alkylhydroperoxidase